MSTYVLCCVTSLRFLVHWEQNALKWFRVQRKETISWNFKGETMALLEMFAQLSSQPQRRAATKSLNAFSVIESTYILWLCFFVGGSFSAHLITLWAFFFLTVSKVVFSERPIEINVISFYHFVCWLMNPAGLISEPSSTRMLLLHQL